jgi:RNA polymerase sigma-70 factor (ECF subfamily)
MQIDKTIILACFQNDRKALYQLYKSCYSPIMSILVRYESNLENVKELINDCFMHIVDNLHLLKDLNEAEIALWIKTVSVRKGIDKYRKTKIEKEKVKYVDFQDEAEENENYESSSVTYNEAESKLSAEDLEKMLKQLPYELCLVFNLSVIDGFPHKEIASILGITESSSRVYLSQARKMLKKLVSQRMAEKTTTA